MQKLSCQSRDKRQASAIHKLLQKRERVLKFEHQFKGYIADRIVGIDAANSELFAVRKCLPKHLRGCPLLR